MQVMSALGGTGLIAQAMDFARGLMAEWRRLSASIESRLDDLAERQRLAQTQFPPLRILRLANERLGGLLDRALDTQTAVQARPMQPIAERLTEEQQWALATQGFQDPVGSAEQAVALHETAALQIDAAVYALDGLFHDLRNVMSVSYRDNVFAHQTDYTEHYADTLYAAAVQAAVKEASVPRHVIGHRRAA